MMSTLYNCHTDGDQYRITKFDSFGNVESTYLCSETECQCPAGPRPTCRHREMLPKFLAQAKVNSFWFYDYDRGGWVMNEPAPNVRLEDIPVDEDGLEAELEDEELVPAGLPQNEAHTFVYTTDEPPLPITGVRLFVDCEPNPQPAKPWRRI